jgi:hypothetical protein
MRFFNVSHTVAEAPSTSAFDFSMRIWPFGPHRRMDLSLRSSHSREAAEDIATCLTDC